MPGPWEVGRTFRSRPSAFQYRRHHRARPSSLLDLPAQQPSQLASRIDCAASRGRRGLRRGLLGRAQTWEELPRTRLLKQGPLPCPPPRRVCTDLSTLCRGIWGPKARWPGDQVCQGAPFNHLGPAGSFRLHVDPARLGPFIPPPAAAISRQGAPAGRHWRLCRDELKLQISGQGAHRLAARPPGRRAWGSRFSAPANPSCAGYMTWSRGVPGSSHHAWSSSGRCLHGVAAIRDRMLPRFTAAATKPGGVHLGTAQYQPRRVASRSATSAATPI